LSCDRITTLIGTSGASRRAVSTIRIEVSSRPAETITARAVLIRAASSAALRVALPSITVTPQASACCNARAESSITTTVCGSAPRRTSSRTASDPLVP
jgi:hypothetical protein